MDRYIYEDHDEDRELATVESYYNDTIPDDEFPDEPYGTEFAAESLGKKPWRMNQNLAAPFGYENKAFHAGMPRDYPSEDHTALSIPEVLDEP